jgi:hypothetical protein
MNEADIRVQEAEVQEWDGDEVVEHEGGTSGDTQKVEEGAVNLLCLHQLHPGLGRRVERMGSVAVAWKINAK